MDEKSINETLSKKQIAVWIYFFGNKSFSKLRQTIQKKKTNY